MPAAAPEQIIADHVRLNAFTRRVKLDNAKQVAFLMLTCRDAFYGGAAGGGKSGGILASALQYVDEPNYNALLLRNSLAELELPRALIPLSKEWLYGTGAIYRESKHRWDFPAGGTLTFGYLEKQNSEKRYAGSEFDFIGLDEASQIRQSQLRFMFSRLRRRFGSRIPPRFRVASNPGGPGHDWIKARYIEPHGVFDRITIRAALDDNPSIDRVAYLRSMDELDEITRRQLLEGDWTARAEGGQFRREWLNDKYLEAVPRDWSRMVRYWDLAATKPKGGSDDPDWTAGELWALCPGPRYLRVSGVRRRDTPGEIEKLIRSTAEADAAAYGRGVEIFMEQEPGASGVSTIAHYARLLSGFAFRADRKDTSKALRARPYAAAWQNGLVYVVVHPSVSPWMDEHEAYVPGSPYGHDDQLDASSGAFNKLALTARPVGAGAGSDHAPSYIRSNYDD